MTSGNDDVAEGDDCASGGDTLTGEATHETASAGAEPPEDLAVSGGTVTATAPVRRRVVAALAPVLTSLVLVASIAFALIVYFTAIRQDEQTDQRASSAATKAASDATVAVLSYAPDSLDSDFARAKAMLTGEFLNYYTHFTSDVVTPAVRQKNVKTSATIVRAAVMEIHPVAAVVLVFVNQTTTSNSAPDGSFTTSSVKVGLSRTNGEWLVGSFDPV
jgi:Mce-associated membrane protein